MKFSTSLAAALFVVTAGTASATTYTFNATGPDNLSSIDFGDFTVSASAEGILNFCGATISQNSNGLGVDGCPDTDPKSLDGFPVGSSERLTFTFNGGKTAKLTKIDFSKFQAADGPWGGDDYSLYLNDALVGSLNDDPWIGSELVTSFAIEAKGLFEKSDLFIGDDSFRVKKISYELQAVPLPAAGWLLLAGIGGLAALRRTRKA